MSNEYLYSWGYSKFHQTGNFSHVILATPTEIEIEGLSKEEKQICCGEFSTCIIDSKNTVTMFGKKQSVLIDEMSGLNRDNYFRQRLTFKIKEIALGSEHGIILFESGEIRTFGLNVFGQLGTGNFTSTNTPMKVSTDANNKELPRILKIAAGAMHSVLLTEDFYLFACGYNKHKAAGFEEEKANLFTNTDICLEELHELRAGVNHTVAFKEGDSSFIIFGCGSKLVYENACNQKVKLEADAGIKDVRIGHNFLALLTTSNSVFVFGDNSHSQLGIGNKEFETKFRRISDRNKIAKIRVGFYHGIALSESGQVFTWGESKFGQHCDMKKAGFSKMIEKGALDVACGGYHNVVVLSEKLKTGSEYGVPFVSSSNSNAVLQKYSEALKKIYEIGSEYAGTSPLSGKNQGTRRSEKLNKEPRISVVKRVSAFNRANTGHRRSLSNIPQEKKGNYNINVSMQDIKKVKDVGKGSFGTVFLGLFGGMEVAVKTFFGKKGDKKTVTLWRNEMKIMQKLRHPNICSLIAFNFEVNDPFLVMEYCPNGDLYSLLYSSKQNLRNKMKFRILIDVAKALFYMHSFKPPIVHRDLKSLNILLDSSNRAKITDFGTAYPISKPASGKKGTVLWMAPEMLLGNSHDEKADVYSFGRVVMEVFEQMTPFSSVKMPEDKAQAVAVLELIKDKKDIKFYRTPYPVRKLVVSCLKFDPTDRPDMETVLDNLVTFEKMDVL